VQQQKKNGRRLSISIKQELISGVPRCGKPVTENASPYPKLSFILKKKNQTNRLTKYSY
jgi:hypothetical protein